MKKYLITLALLIISSILLSSQAFAIGIGGYITISKGGHDWTYTDDDTDTESDVSSDVSKFGAGFVLDTAVAKDRLFNYRLNVGYTKLTIDNESSAPDIDGFDFHCYNTFGFGLARTESLRFWIGPQIGLGFLYGEYDISSDAVSNDFLTAFLGLGLAAGMNFHVGDRLSLGLDGGYRISTHGGGANIDSASFTITGDGKELFANISFIFRIKDSYASEKSAAKIRPVNEDTQNTSADDDLDLNLELD